VRGFYGRKSVGILGDSSESRLDRFWRKTLPAALATEAIAVDAHIREGRFQRCMALMAGTSSILAGLEVSYEHYRGSFGQKVMWTPVVLSGATAVSGFWGFFSKWPRELSCAGFGSDAAGQRCWEVKHPSDATRKGGGVGTMKAAFAPICLLSSCSRSGKTPKPTHREGSSNNN
jgi:hypothetical protein